MKQNFEEPQHKSERSSTLISERMFMILISLLSVIGILSIYLISLNLQSLTITIAGTTALVGYKNLRIAQDKLALDQETSKQNLSITEGKQTTERFSKAIEHLGDDKVDIQLGGIYELEQIAMGSKEYHWTIIEILSSFVRRKSSIQQNAEPEKDGDLTVDTAIIVIARRKARQDPEGKWINLRRVNLAEIEIEKKANFVEADLREVNFSKAKMFEVNLSQANLSQANLSGASLIGANLSNTDLHGSKLNLADLRRANLDGANLFEVNLSQANLSRASLIKADMRGADLSKTNLCETNLSEADLSGTNLCGAKLRRANLSGVDLIIADLKGADLCGADLRGADLGGANLYGADLSNADLSGANLGDSILSEAENLTPEQIKKACYWKTAKYELGKLDELKQDKASDPQEPVNCSQWDIQNSL